MIFFGGIDQTGWFQPSLNIRGKRRREVMPRWVVDDVYPKAYDFGEEAWASNE